MEREKAEKETLLKLLKKEKKNNIFKKQKHVSNLSNIPLPFPNLEILPFFSFFFFLGWICV